MLLRSMPRAERETEYCSAEQVRLVSHLRDHLLTERDSYVSLSRLAEEHHLSVSHLQKLFRQVYGAPICRYLKEYRLEKGAVELSGSERRIVEIALDAGYESASKFSSAFKQRYGVPPAPIVLPHAVRQNGILKSKRNRNLFSGVAYCATVKTI